MSYIKKVQISGVANEDLPGTYLKRVQIVEVLDSEGNPWEPVPGPDPWDELVVNDKALYHESNIYEIGETVYATTATFIGGDPSQTTYRWRWQWRQASDGAWANSSWTNYNNTLEQVSYIIPNSGDIRFQCQARDTSVDPANQVNSFGAIKTIPYSEFGDLTVTVNDIDYDYTVAPALTILMNDPMPVIITHTGNASPTYSWEARNEYPLMVGSQAASTVLTFPQAGAVTVTCTLRDTNTEEVTTSVILNFFVVDAFD